MQPVIATTLRRTALAGAALGATLAGHLAATPDTGVLPAAPILWLAMIALLVPFGAAGRGDGTFTAWGPVRTLVTLVAAQALLHGTMHWSPWMFGLVEHHDSPLITPAAIAVHGVVALLLVVPLCAGQRILERLLAVVRALVPAVRRGALPRPACPAPRFPASVTAAPRAPRTSRGPPAARLQPGLPGTA